MKEDTNQKHIMTNPENIIQLSRLIAINGFLRKLPTHILSLLGPTWYCSEECALGEDDDDNVQQYCLAVVWHGLNLLANHDAIREGDGPALISGWKLDMLQFWTRRHPKYLIIGHMLLAS